MEKSGIIMIKFSIIIPDNFEDERCHHKVRFLLLLATTQEVPLGIKEAGVWGRAQDTSNLLSVFAHL